MTTKVVDNFSRFPDRPMRVEPDLLENDNPATIAFILQAIKELARISRTSNEFVR
jgi:hypothetical protein